jgi:hypothetical protein
VFCVDEKTAIQALDRLDPVLPLSPGRAERHGFEYYRHGTLSLYAVLNTQSGKVLSKTAARHTSQEFVEFLTEVVERAPARTGARPDLMEPFARTIDVAKKYVVSSTVDRVDWNAELVRGDLGTAVQQLKRESGKVLG